MKTHKQIILLLMTCFIPCSFAASALYRWVDDQGRVHFSDKVPPDEARREIEHLSKHGMVRSKESRQQTPEEVAEALRRKKTDKIAKDRETSALLAARELLMKYTSMAELDAEAAKRENYHKRKISDTEESIQKLQNQLKASVSSGSRIDSFDIRRTIEEQETKIVEAKRVMDDENAFFKQERIRWTEADKLVTEAEAKTKAANTQPR